MADINLTPMMQQYREAKASIPPDAVLLFRLGDFYEEFFEDAERVSSVLELTLTRRQGYPMCGFPYHALDTYLPRLVAAGVKVAIAEQMEDPRLAKGIVKRQITRVITPGTIVDNALLSPSSNNFLTCLVQGKNDWALASLDISTGEFRVCRMAESDKLVTELNRLGARECVVSHRLDAQFEEEGSRPEPRTKLLWTTVDNDFFELGCATDFLLRQFKVGTLDGFGLRELPHAVSAAGAVLRYATENLRQDAAHICKLDLYSLDHSLELDSISLRNLELVETMFGSGKSGSLLGVLDHTETPMGGRKLRGWVLRPLYDHDAIVARLDAVEAFRDDPLTLAELRETIGVVRDLERIVGRLNVGNANARDLQTLAVSLGVLPGVKSLLSIFSVPLLETLNGRLELFPELVEKIESAIAENPPALLSDGGVIRAGYCPELDELRSAATDGKAWLSQIQLREQERTGIRSLKVKYNSVFGYYIEVSKSNLSMVPEDYVRKQTLVNAERFITPELKELESKILGAEEKAKALEAQLFQELREFALQYTSRIQTAADALAEVDALASLAECARLHGYHRPQIFDDDRLVIRGGRHPVLDATLGSDKFVPNDCLLDGDRNRMMLITGPNMAGKSTYIRQTALLVVLAQMGSFVPADSMELGLVDRIFTRVGAADDLARGQSTFMVEMVETANILNHVTPKSLVILDEIGRGTSTFDGLSIAWAVAEFLHDDPSCRCRTQFATHYHELTELAQTRRGVNNYNVAVKEYGDQIIFLRQIVPGSTDRSYGIHVAKLAGIPQPVIERANVILELLEKTADAPREAISSLPRQTVKAKRRSRGDSDENDDMIQLRLL
ncbi:MAG: DNA mismatch repair protein MutS [Lentisphaeria bacterium]|nr:DNA mismatch repair protein MutS [Lentisphaeria bacterium]